MYADQQYIDEINQIASGHKFDQTQECISLALHICSSGSMFYKPPAFVAESL